MLKIVVILCASINIIYCLSSGAPHSACDDMKPHHHSPPQNSSLPYKILISKNRIQPNEKVIIRIYGKPFRGFLLMVSNGTHPIGSFDVSNSYEFSQTLNCHGMAKSAVTHKTKDIKKQVEMVWTAPKIAGKYKIMATIVQNYTTFWVKQIVGSIIVH